MQNDDNHYGSGAHPDFEACVVQLEVRRYTAARINFSLQKSSDMRCAVLCTTQYVVQTKQKFKGIHGCMSIAISVCIARRAVMSIKQGILGCCQHSILNPGLAFMCVGD